MTDKQWSRRALAAEAEVSALRIRIETLEADVAQLEAALTLCVAVKDAIRDIHLGRTP